jgi:hypothetical protein
MRASLELKQIPEAVQAMPGIRGPLDLLDPASSVPIVLSLLIAVLVVMSIPASTLDVRITESNYQKLAQ